jgi:hypothetical protein
LREHKDPTFEPEFESRARGSAFADVLERWSMAPNKPAILGFRRVARSNDDRTAIATLLPTMPLTYGWIVVLDPSSRQQALLLANFNSLVFDYCLRNKLSQPSIPQGVFQQTATLPPYAYTPADAEFIIQRVLELSYTSRSMAPFARDLGYKGRPFDWDEDRRAKLRSELDAWYARAYGLTRDELRYVLDPTDARGPDYPSETFRVLRKNEIARFDEYQTARLVLASYDALTKHPLAAE